MAGRESQEALSTRISMASEKVTVGAKYSHYKRKEDSYLVRDIAILEATDEPCVIYQTEYGDKVTFVRPVPSWLGMVDLQGESVPRFSKIDS
jgi:hypothetical protein